MHEIRKDLIRVKTYADRIKKSTTHVYELVRKKKVDAVIIDDIVFIKVA